MPKKFLLTTFSGYPRGLSFFCVDIGLLTLAKVIRDNGNLVKIIDFNNSNLLLNTLSCDESNFYEKSLKKSVNNDSFEKLIELKSELENEFYTRAKNIIFNKLDQEIAEQNIDVLGVKLWLGPSLPLFTDVLKTLKTKYPKLFIIAGGPSVTAIGPDILPYLKCMDAVAFGDGEPVFETINDFLDGMINLSDIPNIWFNDEANGFTPSAKQTFGSFASSLAPVMTEDIYPGLIAEKINLTLIEDSRGCSFACPFCPHSASSLGQQRQRAVSDVISNIKDANSELGTTVFRFTGSCPFPKFFNGFASEIEPNRFYFSSFFHPGYQHLVDFTRLHKSGFRAFLLGIESVDQINIKTFLKRKMLLSDMALLGNKLVNTNIFASLSFILPQIHPDYSAFKFFLNTYPFHKNMSSILMSFPTVYPGTPWWKNPDYYSIDILNKNAYLQNIIFKTNHNEFLTLSERSNTKLWNEFANTRQLIQNNNISIDINDETALLALSIGLEPKALATYQNKLLNTFNLAAFNKLRQDVNFILAQKTTQPTHNIDNLIASVAA
ncbi:MAG: cobalamin B12-binding domain-containing protein [Deltaproteobacteria bacterium]|nr:cobalamin B12-binding domain-containing protein [Deltaproteobacteria bacterium]